MGLNECMDRLSKNPFESICYSHLEAFVFLLKSIKLIQENPANYAHKFEQSIWRCIIAYFEFKLQVVSVLGEQSKANQSKVNDLYRQGLKDYSSAKTVLENSNSLVGDSNINAFETIFAALSVFVSQRDTDLAKSIFVLLLKCSNQGLKQAESQKNPKYPVSYVSPKLSGNKKVGLTLFAPKAKCADPQQKHIERMQRAREYRQKPWPFNY